MHLARLCGKFHPDIVRVFFDLRTHLRDRLFHIGSIGRWLRRRRCGLCGRRFWRCGSCGARRRSRRRGRRRSRRGDRCRRLIARRRHARRHQGFDHACITTDRTAHQATRHLPVEIIGGSKPAFKAMVLGTFERIADHLRCRFAASVSGTHLNYRRKRVNAI